jgi:hypothetical protein
LVVTTSRDASGLKAALPHGAQVGALELRQRAARLGLDQADHLVQIPDDQEPAVGGEAEADAADPPRLAPRSDFPEPARRGPVHQPSPIGAETDSTVPLGQRMSRLLGVANPPDLEAGLPMTPRGQPLAIGADGDVSAFVERPDPAQSLWGQDVTLSSGVVGHGHDPARSVLGESAFVPRQRQLMGRADAELIPAGVQPHRPAPDAGHAVGQQVARRLEHRVGPADRQESQLRAAGQVPQDHAQGGAHGQDAAVTMGRGAPVLDRPACRIGQSPILEGRIDLVGVPLVLLPKDDPAIAAENEMAATGQIEPDRPRTGSQSQRRPSQPLLASSVPAGWKPTRSPELV